MNKIRRAIEILEVRKSFCADINIDAIMAYNLAIKALEKQASFENEVGAIRDWFVDNKDCLLDDAMKVADAEFEENNSNDYIDKVDLDTIVEDIVDKIQEGILNVLDSYKTK